MRIIHFDIDLEHLEIPKPDFRISPEDTADRMSLDMDTDGFVVYSPVTGRRLKFPTIPVSDMPLFSFSNDNRGKK